MRECNIYYGSVEDSKKCCSIGYTNNLWFIACSLNGNVKIFDRNLKEIQCLNDNLNYISNVVCCKVNGNILITSKRYFFVYESIYSDNCYKWVKSFDNFVDNDILCGEWYYNGNRIIISSGYYLEIYERTLINSEIIFKRIWRYCVSMPITSISASSDSMFFASIGEKDRKVTIWYEMKSCSDNELIFDFTILNHPTFVVGFEWRRIPDEMFCYQIENCIITFCKDNVARVWKENVIDDELYIGNDIENLSDLLFNDCKVEVLKKKNDVSYFSKIKEKIMATKNCDDEIRRKKKLIHKKKTLSTDLIYSPFKVKKTFFYIVTSIISENIVENVDFFGYSTNAFTPHWLNNKYLFFLKNYKNSSTGEGEIENNDNETSKMEEYYYEWRDNSDGIFTIDEKSGAITIWNIFNLDSSYRSCDAKLISSIQNSLSLMQSPSEVWNALILPFENIQDEELLLKDEENSTLITIYSNGKIDISKTKIYCQSNLTFLETVKYYTSLNGARYPIKSISSHKNLSLTFGLKKSTKMEENELELILWKIKNKDNKFVLQELSKVYLTVNEYHSRITWLNRDGDTFSYQFAICYNCMIHIYKINEITANINETQMKDDACGGKKYDIQSTYSIDLMKYGIFNIIRQEFLTKNELFIEENNNYHYLFISGCCQNLKDYKLIIFFCDENFNNFDVLFEEDILEEDIKNIFIINKDVSITRILENYIEFPRLCIEDCNNLLHFYSISEKKKLIKNVSLTFNLPRNTLSYTMYDGKIGLIKEDEKKLVLQIFESKTSSCREWKEESSKIISVPHNNNNNNSMYNSLSLSWLLTRDKIYYLCIQICNEVQIFLANNLSLQIPTILLPNKSNYLLMDWLEENNLLISDGNTLQLYEMEDDEMNKNTLTLQYHPDYLFCLIETNNYDIAISIIRNIIIQMERRKTKKTSNDFLKKILIKPLSTEEIEKIIDERNKKITFDEYIEKEKIKENNIVFNEVKNNTFDDDLFSRNLDDVNSMNSEDFNIDIDSNYDEEEENIDDEDNNELDNTTNYLIQNKEKEDDITEDDCQILINNIGKLEIIGLSGDELCELVSITKGIERCSLIKNNIAYDNCGKKYFFSLSLYSSLRKLKNANNCIYQIPSSSIVWAFHSTSENELFTNVLSDIGDNFSWDNLKKYGVGWWLKHPENIKRCFEKLAQNAFMRKSNPMDAAIYYMVLKKKNIIATLFRKQNDTLKSNFFSQSFTNEKERIFAMKNAFSCISKGEYNNAIAIFLCCDDIENALKVIMERLCDIQLCILVIRTYIINIFEQEKVLEEILLKYVLKLNRKRIDDWRINIEECLVLSHENDSAYNSDPFIRSMAFFLIKEYYLSSLTLLYDHSYNFKHHFTTFDNLSCYLTSIYTFYQYLRKHPYVLRQKLKGYQNNLSFHELSKKNVTNLTHLEKTLYLTASYQLIINGNDVVAKKILDTVKDI
uniref:Rav1p_C domain-containing protein n=1 Tax=Parastrongyloides trichosuri TaxID=131310 RepID=A0A0N4Z110_PARTI